MRMKTLYDQLSTVVEYSASYAPLSESLEILLHILHQSQNKMVIKRKTESKMKFKDI